MDEAKLGDKNKFYYDEKLKTWVEEGAETPAEAAAPPPPPTTASFPISPADNISKNAFADGGPATDSSPDFRSSTSSESSAGLPSIPPSLNQFSARGRLGVRARYVDTFNKGGGSPANLFQTPSAPSIKPGNATGAKFFIPTAAAASNEQPSDAFTGSMEAVESTEPLQNLGSFSHSATKPRFSSFDGIPMAETKTNSHDSPPSLSRRTASWDGSNSNTFSSPEIDKFHHPGKSLGMSPLSSMASNSSLDNLRMSRESLGDDLQEVEL
ncbi:hypothetical protein Dimus_034897 [Dionaea muscipula]